VLRQELTRRAKQAVVRSNIANILWKDDLQPAPERHRNCTWKEFLCRLLDVIVVTDIFPVAAWTPGA